MNSRIVGHPFGDSTEYLHHIWWIKHALQTGQPIFDQPLLLYPDGLNGALLWSIPLQSFPAWLFAFVMPLHVAFNLTALLFLALNGWSMWFFVSNEFRVTSNEEGQEQGLRTEGKGLSEQPRLSLITHYSLLVPHFSAFLAGLIFMAYPAFQGQLAIGHIGLLAVFPTPLLMTMLFRLRRQTNPSDQVGDLLKGEPTVRPYGLMIIGAILFAMTGWGSLVLFVYLTAPLVGCFVLMLVVKREWRAFRWMLTTLILGGMLAAVFVVPGLAAPTADEGRSLQYSASLLSIIAPSFQHPLWGQLLDYPRRILGVEPFEGAAYIGVIAGGLALIGVIRRRGARYWLVVAALAWILSLGGLLKIVDAPVTAQIDGYPTFVTLPAALLERLPVLNLARTPGRFNFAVGFAVAVMAGYGVNELLNAKTQRRKDAKKNLTQRDAEERREKLENRKFIENSLRLCAFASLRYVSIFTLYALILFDYQQFFPIPTIPAAIPSAIADIASTDARAVFDIPFAHPLTDKDAMYLQTAHQTPMIAGHIARETPLDPARGWLLEGTLDPALLDLAGVDVILLHKEWDDPEGETEARLRAAFGAPVYEDERIARFDLPDDVGDPPTRRLFTHADDRSGILYVYMPEAGTGTLIGTVRTGTPLEMTIALNETPILSWRVERETDLRVPLIFDLPGFYTVTVAAEPCPAVASSALRCIPVEVEGLTLE